MKLSDLFLNRWLFKTDQSVETQGSDYVAGNINPAPSNTVASGNSVYDINSNAQYINGNTILPGSIPPDVLDVSNWGWTQTCVFTVVDNNTVSWGAGTFTSANGVSYSISGNNTGNMSAKTYVYLDITTITNAYQTTTNVNNTVGVGKVLIAVCENAAVTATYVLVQATQIVGDNILANTINASKITAGSITATQIATQTITANEIASQTITATQIAANTITATQIASGTITATQIAANAVTADKLTAGVFQVGGTSEPTAILVAAGSISGNSRISFNTTSGARIWGDSSNNIGINGTGGAVYIYANSEEVAIFQSGSNKTIFKKELSCQNTVYLSSGTSTSIWGNNNTDVIIDMTGSFYVKDGGSECFRANSVGATTQGYFYSQGSNKMEFKDWTLTLTADKTAIVPTSKGFNALYCTESPEVWFMDFCGEDKILDPMFLEVTVRPYHFIKCEDGEYQVWGKRKGHEKKRFESKTEKEFIANERFLNMSKPN
jgi:hypothetical protein